MSLLWVTASQWGEYHDEAFDGPAAAPKQRRPWANQPAGGDGGQTQPHGRWACDSEYTKRRTGFVPNCAYDPPKFDTHEAYEQHMQDEHGTSGQAFPYHPDDQKNMNIAFGSIKDQGLHHIFQNYAEHGPTHYNGVTSWPHGKLDTGHTIGLYSHTPTNAWDKEPGAPTEPIGPTEFRAHIFHPDDPEGAHPLHTIHLGENPHQVGSKLADGFRDPELRRKIKDPGDEWRGLMADYHRGNGS